MSGSTWPAIVKRIDRIRRHRRIAAWLLRLLRLDEVEAIPRGEYALVCGYVVIWNDVQPVVKTARNVVDGIQTVEELAAALGRFDAARDDRDARG